jgi:hypothetical protein
MLGFRPPPAEPSLPIHRDRRVDVSGANRCRHDTVIAPLVVRSIATDA